ncbi:MAG: 2,3-bisphosphoglycerate-independent phosphoglycerate mutase [Ignavibacteria bacterium]|nr:2,3-bisphosphoglycerate-independent phosphoglycerate mutase [Ignavibacteria bacterium]
MNSLENRLFLIVDGWGVGDGSQSDVISIANTPYWDKLIATYPNSKLLTCGENVGLPDGQMGNSEVGHLNIGAGRIVYQDLVKINKEIREGKIDKNPVLVEAFKYAKENNKAVHFLVLVSDGGDHSLDKHLYKLCDMTKDFGLERVFIHALTDGRDTDPRSGYGFVKNLLEHLEHSNGKIASLCGRYYTMDRDKRWERVKQGYDLITKGIGKPTTDILKAIQESYDEGVTDEFINPIVCVDDNGKPLAVVQEGDVFICFNFRTDRLREITIALTQKDMHEFDMHTIDLYYLTMTRYDDTFQNVRVIYDKENVSNTLGEVVSKAGLRQLRIAETEKYAHVTFFFSGGREEVFENEDRILIHSPKVPTYDLKPEMSAFEVKDALVEQLNTQKYDFICLNFANGDMVGHTGVYEAIRKAVEAVDVCLSEVVETARKNDYTVLILADHGNADYAKNPDGSPNTAHSLNPVPFIVVSDEYKIAKDGILADVAPTVLNIMGLPIPQEMTGKILIE